MTRCGRKWKARKILRKDSRLNARLSFECFQISVTSISALNRNHVNMQMFPIQLLSFHILLVYLVMVLTVKISLQHSAFGDIKESSFIISCSS